MSESRSRGHGSPVREAILVAVQLPDVSDADVTRSLDELEHLVTGLGVPVGARFVQKRPDGTSPAYVGEGKLRELAQRTGGLGVAPRGPRAGPDAARDDVLVVADAELSPGQLRNLQAALGVEVLDRTGVILRVFEARARTREARLEIELARLAYELPRLRELRGASDKEGGGGRASRGHTEVELAKQRVRERMAALRRELDQLLAQGDRRRAARTDTLRAALVGYTNSGKSSLMRRLTGADVYVEDKLFATLGTTTRPLVPPAAPPVLLSDTVGFVQRLPHALIASFRSTLAEAAEASLLLVVADASDPAFPAHVRVTEDVLGEIGAGDRPRLLVLNKADRLSSGAREALEREHPDAVFASAVAPGGTDELRRRVVARLGEALEERTFVVPYARMGVWMEARPRLRVVREEHGEALVATAQGLPESLDQLAARLARLG